jgi:DNA modification methylase
VGDLVDVLQGKTDRTIICGNCLDVLPTFEPDSIDCVVTSPPYWGLRIYIDDENPLKSDELGSEKLHDCLGWATKATCGNCYVCNLTTVFREIRRVLKPTGTVWLNLGDSYAGGGRAGKNPEYHAKHTMFGKSGYDPGQFGLPVPVPKGLKAKDLVGIPWRVALALQADGWYLRSDIIWHKPNPMPESCQDRPTSSYEHVFLLSKSPSYYYDSYSIREPESESTTSKNKYDRNEPRSANLHHGSGFMVQPANSDMKGGRNKRNVWTINTEQFPGSHFAVFPRALVIPMLLAGCPKDGTALDPFCGSGTVGVVCRDLNTERQDHPINFIGIELNPTYSQMARDRIADSQYDDKLRTHNRIEKQHEHQTSLFEDSADALEGIEGGQA